MRYICPECNYIFDESVWDKYEDIKAWTKLHDLWVDFKCPICWEYWENFQEIIEEVNYIDENNILWLEFEHFINVIELEDNKIEVTVWKWDFHPSGEEHRISQISLFDEYWDLVQEYFLWVWEEPKVEFDIDWLDEYKIIARCTIHWLWGRKIKND
jgi:rubredoxin